MTEVVKDRFEIPLNPCDGCRWYYLKADSESPCSHCIHNEMHIVGVEETND